MKKVLEDVFEMYCVFSCLGSMIGLFACYMFIPLHGKEWICVLLFTSNFVLDFLMNKYVRSEDE